MISTRITIRMTRTTCLIGQIAPNSTARDATADAAANEDEQQQNSGPDLTSVFERRWVSDG